MKVPGIDFHYKRHDRINTRRFVVVRGNQYGDGLLMYGVVRGVFMEFEVKLVDGYIVYNILGKKYRKKGDNKINIIVL